MMVQYPAWCADSAQQHHHHHHMHGSPSSVEHTWQECKMQTHMRMEHDRSANRKTHMPRSFHVTAAGAGETWNITSGTTGPACMHQSKGTYTCHTPMQQDGSTPLHFNHPAPCTTLTVVHPAPPRTSTTPHHAPPCIVTTLHDCMPLLSGHSTHMHVTSTACCHNGCAAQ